MKNTAEATAWVLADDNHRSGDEPSRTSQGLPDGGFDWEQVCSFLPQAVAESRLVALTNGNTLGSEKFRLLSTRLRHLQQQRGARTVVFTSAAAEDGKTLVAANLAVTLAQRQKQRILLLEGDLRNPVLAKQFGLEGSKGLSDWWENNYSLNQFLYKVEDLQLWLLPAGRLPEHPLEILQSVRLPELLARLSRLFDWVLIDSPPLLPLADAHCWAQLADGILLVVRQGKTSKKLLEKGLERLDNPAVLGIVLNDSTGLGTSNYQRYQAIDLPRNGRPRNQAPTA